MKIIPPKVPENVLGPKGTDFRRCQLDPFQEFPNLGLEHIFTETNY